MTDNKPTDTDKKAEDWETELRAEADANGGIVETYYGPYYDDDNRLAQIAEPARPAKPASDSTEVLLNGLIEDCRLLIHEVILQSARLTRDASHRIQFMSSASTLAVTGAKIGRTIARLRQDRPPLPDENRYRMIVEHVGGAPGKARRAAKGREGKKKTR